MKYKSFLNKIRERGMNTPEDVIVTIDELRLTVSYLRDALYRECRCSELMDRELCCSCTALKEI